MERGEEEIDIRDSKSHAFAIWIKKFFIHNGVERVEHVFFLHCQVVSYISNSSSFSSTFRIVHQVADLTLQRLKSGIQHVMPGWASEECLMPILTLTMTFGRRSTKLKRIEAVKMPKTSR